MHRLISWRCGTMSLLFAQGHAAPQTADSPQTMLPESGFTKPPSAGFADFMALIRFAFLLLAVVCAVLGLGTAVYTSGSVNLLQVVLVMVGATLSHISVNTFNEYFDFRSGLDFRTTHTPFNGGSGTLQKFPALAPVALGIASSALLITCAIGLYFLWARGVAMLPLGLLGVLLVAMYTPALIRNPWVCLMAPGLGFGVCMVVGTQVALTGQYTWTALFASLVPFFFVNNLLLLNQFPDVEADRTVGRRHFPILIGRRKSSHIYALFQLLGYVSLGAGVLLRYLPAASLLGMLTLVFTVPAVIGAYRYSDEPAKLMPAQGFNVIVNLATPVLMAIGMFIVRAH